MTIDLDPAVSPHLQGLLAPTDAELDVEGLTVHGTLPGQLHGLFLRNGPNPQFTPLDGYHPFDGDGMLHGIYLEGGRARYRNRWIESKGLLAERRRGHALYGGIGKWVAPPPDVLAEAGMLKNTANTHTVRHAGRLFALMEVGAPTEVTRELETIGEHDFDGALQGGMTAHPKIDPATGELFFFGYSPIAPYLRYHRVDAEGALVQTVDIDLPNPVMMHDFVVTERHVVFLDAPGIFDLASFMAGGPAVRWDPDQGTRIGVLPREAVRDEVRWFDVDPSYVVHFFNAWESGSTITVHGPAFPAMPAAFGSSAPGELVEPFPWEWTIDLEAGAATARQVDDRSGEFPRIDDRRATRRHRYGYNTLPRSWQFEFDFHGVVKYDLEAGTDQTLFYGDTEVCGEHVFAPDPDGAAEDDGWLLSLVTDRATERSVLAITDARDLEAGPIARIGLPQRVPLGFHANWLPE